MFKRVLSLLLCISLLATSAFAAELTTSGGDGETEAELTQAASTFSVTVPGVLPVDLDQDGNVTVASNAVIRNDSVGPVKVSAISVSGINGWTLADFGHDFLKEKVGTKKFGFHLVGSAVPVSGVVDVSSLTSIAGNGGSMPITYDADVTAQASAVTVSIARVVFTVAWDTTDGVTGGSSESEITGYEIVSVEDLPVYDDHMVLLYGQVADLNAVALYGSEAPLWSSSDPSVAYITEDGFLYGKDFGVVDITYTVGGLSETITVEVAAPVMISKEALPVFGYDGSETEMEIPAFVRQGELLLCTALASESLTGCPNLETLVLPDTFFLMCPGFLANCTSLKSVTLGKGFKYFDPTTFLGVNPDMEIKYNGTVEQFDDVIFTNPAAASGLEIICLDGVATAPNTTNGSLYSGPSWEISSGVLTISGEGPVYGMRTESLDAYVTLPWVVLESTYGCSSFTSLVFEEGITSVGSFAFGGHTALASIYLPSSLVHLSSDAFVNLASLTSVHYNGTIAQFEQIDIEANAVLVGLPIICTDGTTTLSLGGECGDSLEWSLSDAGVLTISGTGAMYDFDYGSYYTYDYPGWYLKVEEITAVVIEDGVTSIGDCAFEYCENLTSVTIPDSVTSIGDYAFCGCETLESVQLPSNLTSIGFMAFDSCYSLTGIDIPAGVTSIGLGAFCYCYSLSDISVADANSDYCSVDGVLYSEDMQTLYQYPAGKSGTSFVVPSSVRTLADYSFGATEYLTSVTLNEGLQTIGYLVFEGSYISSITIPASVTSIDGNTFAWAYYLTGIDVVAGNTAYCDVDGVLYTADMSTLVSYPSYKVGTSYIVNTGTSVIGPSAFIGTYLGSVVLPAGVTQIGAKAFQYCEYLTTVELPTSLTQIGSNAFAGCTTLATVNYTGSADQLNAVDIVSGNNEFLSATFNCNCVPTSVG